MKRLFVKIIIFGLLTIIVPIIINHFVPSNPNGYLKAYGDKVKRNSLFTDNRLLVVGASEMAFGINSKILEKQLNKNVINFGLHAGLGVDFILDDARKHAKKGDIIILCPSIINIDGETTSIPYLVDYFPYKWFDLSYGNIVIGIKGTYKLLYKKIMYNNEKIDRNNGHFNYDCFNEYGDYSKYRKQKHEIATYKCPKFNADDYKPYIECLKDLKNKGCIIYVIPRPYNFTSYSASQKDILKIENYFKQNGFPFILHHKDVCFSDSVFFDQCGHLNSIGADLYTGLIIKEMKDHIEKV